jgi:hypothetical protein
MQKSRQWSNATLTKTELDIIEAKVRLELQKVLMGNAPKALKNKYSALSKKCWFNVGGVDNGPIGSAQFSNFVNDFSLITENELGGHYIYNDYDSKAYFKLIVKLWGD